MVLSYSWTNKVQLELIHNFSVMARTFNFYLIVSIGNDYQTFSCMLQKPAAGPHLAGKITFNIRN